MATRYVDLVNGNDANDGSTTGVLAVLLVGAAIKLKLMGGPQ